MFMEAIRLMVVLCITIIVKLLLFVPKLALKISNIILLTLEFFIESVESEFLNTKDLTNGRKTRT